MRWRYLEQWALPQERLAAPLYVWYGGKDPFIDAAWTRAAIARACVLGGTITIEFEPVGGHNPPERGATGHMNGGSVRWKARPDDC